MMLLTQAIKKKLPALYSQENNPDPNCVVKFFTPDSSFTWYITEGSEQENGDWLFFGKTVSHMCPDGELGYVVLSELQSAKGPLGLSIERDKYFGEHPLSECK